MSDFKINNKASVPKAVVKVAPQLEGQALDAMKRNGLDDVAFRLNGDLYIASESHNRTMSKAQPTDEVEFKGGKGRIVAVDHEASAYAAKANHSVAHSAILGAIPIGAIGLASAIMEPTRAGALKVGVVGAVGGAVVGAIFGAASGMRDGVVEQPKEHPEAIKNFGAEQ